MMQDAYLPQRLVDKLMLMYNYIEMARVTGVPMSFLLTRGQSIKVFCMILRKARQRRLLIPNIKVALRPRCMPACAATWALLCLALGSAARVWPLKCCMPSLCWRMCSLHATAMPGANLLSTVRMRGRSLRACAWCR